MPHGTTRKKNASGSGTIRKKTVQRGGKAYTYWEARYTVGFDPGTGKQRQRSITGKTQKEVREKLRQVTAELDLGIYQEPSKLTVDEWLDIWTGEYLGGVKPRTAALYKSTVAVYLKPAFGAVKLDALSAHAIQRFCNQLRDERGLSAKTIKNIHGVFHKGLQQAVKLGYIRFNPAGACELPRIERKEIRPLDEEAIGRFMEAVKGHRFETAFLVALFTGMRQGELLGLKWECVDFERGKIQVLRQLQKVEGQRGEFHLISPKNGKGRVITPAAFVLALLKKHRAQQMEQRLKAGPLWQGEDYVFCDELGKHLSPHTLYHNYKRIVAEIGLPSARFHDLRHSYAVAALQSGDSVKSVQQNLGHHTAAFTLDVYGHVTDQMMRESADRMEKFIEKVAPNGA